MVRIKGELSSLWKKMIEKLNVNITDSLLEQSLYQEIFELCLREYFYDIDSSSSGAASNTGFDDVILSTDELNIMRYVSGYIARTLLKRYEKKSGDEYIRSVENKFVHFPLVILRVSEFTLVSPNCFNSIPNMLN